MKKPSRPRGLTPLDVIRVETALSRYPVHRLAKHGMADIAIREATADGELTLRWEVSHNSRFGQPGPLAYKVDTLVINRKLEAAGRPVPRVVRLGSLREIAEAAGTGEGNAMKVKRALYQNASAFITARIRYRSTDGAQRSMEIGSSRYGVVFSGETLPDGRGADAVHIVLNDFYREILDTALVRPLDYDYLRALPPAAQRWYELASYQVYAAIRNGRPRARLSYAEFCRHGPQTRCLEWDRARRQMAKVHAPHLRSGYLAAVEFEPTADREGRPDWSMIYTLGPKALGRVLESEAAPPVADPPAGSSPIVAELVARGITPATAEGLAGAHAAEKIAEKLDAFDWLVGRKDRALKRNPAGWLYRAIVDDFAPPPGYVGRAERERLGEAERERLRREEEGRRGRVRAREEAEAVRAYWVRLGAEDRERVEAEAIAAADAETRASCTAGPPALRRLAVAAAREAHIRALLGLPGSA